MTKTERPILSISLDYILNECCPEEKREQVKKDIIEFNRQMLHDSFGYQKRNNGDYFSNYLTIYKTDDNTTWSIRGSYTEFLQRLTLILNCPKNPSEINNETLFDLMLQNKIGELKNIKKPQELKDKFPHIYNDYSECNYKLLELKEKEKKEGSTPEIKALKHQYYAWGIKISFKGFIETQARMYTRFVERKRTYQEQVFANDYNEYIKENLDQKRLFLLVNNELLNSFESREYSRKTMNNYYHPVELALATYKINEDVSIKDPSGETITYKSLQQRVKDIRKEIGLNTKLLEWVIVPDRVLDLDTVKAKQKARSQKMSPRRYKELQRRGIARQQFYETNRPEMKLLGVLKYRGYAAYVYQNGKVMLDREYNENAISSASGNASFLVPAKDFIELSKKDKQELRNNPNVIVFNHNATWEQRVLEYLEKEGSPEEQEESKQLIKKLKEGNY